MIKRRELTQEEKEESEKLRSIWDKRKNQWRNSTQYFTQESAAEALGFGTQGAVSQYLNATIPLNIDIILKFSKFLECNPIEIRPSLENYIGETKITDYDKHYWYEVEPDDKLKHIAKKTTYWSNYTKSVVNKGTGITSILIDKGIAVSEKCLLLEMDIPIFHEFAIGHLILMDPEATPQKNDVIVLSFDNEPATLARYLPGFGELQIEPLERGYPGSVSLQSKQYTIHGVVIWAQPRGYRP